MPPAVYTLRDASGYGARNFSCIAVREMYPELQAPETESCLIQVRPDRTLIEDDRETLYTGIWQSPSGLVLVADHRGIIRMADGKNSTALPGPARVYIDGIWAPAEGFIVVWGATVEARPVMFQFAGKNWTEIAIAIPDRVTAVHGISPEVFYAVGLGGWSGRYDGNRLRVETDRSRSVLYGLHVVGEDEAYACSTSGDVMRGTADGWTTVARWQHTPLRAAAKFQGELWVAAAQGGLLKLQAGELQQASPIQADRLRVTSGGMLCCAPQVIAFTTDGRAFTHTTIDELFQSARRTQETPV